MKLDVLSITEELSLICSSLWWGGGGGHKRITFQDSFYDSKAELGQGCNEFWPLHTG